MAHDKHTVNIVSLERWARPSRLSPPVARTRVCDGGGAVCLRMARKQAFGRQHWPPDFWGSFGQCWLCCAAYCAVGEGFTAFFLASALLAFGLPVPCSARQTGGFTAKLAAAEGEQGGTNEPATICPLIYGELY